MDEAAARERALDAAERLFYARGIQAVGMDAVRDAAGLSLKRLYGLFPSKESLVEAYLERRDTVWRARMAGRVAREDDPRERLLAVFDHLGDWFGEPGFRGCAWINSLGELGPSSPAVVRQVKRHKTAVRDYLADLVAQAGLPDRTAGRLHLLVEGATVAAAIHDTPREPAREAREAAALLLDAAART